MLTSRRGDSAARPVIGPLTKTRRRTQTGSRLRRGDERAGVIASRRRGATTRPYHMVQPPGSLRLAFTPPTPPTLRACSSRPLSSLSFNPALASRLRGGGSLWLWVSVWECFNPCSLVFSTPCSRRPPGAPSHRPTIIRPAEPSLLD